MKAVNDFRTQYDRQRIYCDSGDPIRIEYELRYDGDGVEYLAEVGEVDQYEEIQSHALSVDINYILSKYANGDPEVLQRRQAAYGDFSQMPTTYAEMLNTAIEAQNVFDALPVDVKGRFDNSMAQWLSSYGSDIWLEKMGYNESKSDVVVKEAASDEP